MLLVALPVFIYTKTGSGASTAALFVVELAVTVALGPFVGRLVDRWDLRRTLICTNLAQAVALLPLLAVTADRLWPAYVVAVAQSGLARINNPATVAIVPQLVARPQLVAANAASASASSLARLLGSPLGGIVVETTGLGGVIIADGISFLAVASATWFVRADTSVAARQPIAATLMMSDTTSPETVSLVSAADAVVPVGPDAMVDHDHSADGQLTARGRRSMFVSVCLSGVAQGMFLVLFLSFVVDDLHGKGSEIGAIRGVQAVGGVLGSVVIGRLAARIDPVRLYSFGLAGMGIVSVVIWNGPTVTRAIAVYVVLFHRGGRSRSGNQRGVHVAHPACGVAVASRSICRAARGSQCGRHRRRVVGGGWVAGPRRALDPVRCAVRHVRGGRCVRDVHRSPHTGARRYVVAGGGIVVAVTGLVGAGGVPMSAPHVFCVYC